MENTGDPYNVTADDSIPPGTPIEFSLSITTDNDYETTFSFSIIIGTPCVDHATHDCGNVKLTITRYGALGYMDSDHTQGSGFWYPNTEFGHLYYGAFAAGTDADYVVDRYVGQGGQDDTDWETTTSPNGMVMMFEPGSNNRDEYATARYDDSGHPLSRDLVCAQYSWAWDDATANDFVTMKFVLENNGSTTINDLYAALFMDWNIGTGPQVVNNQGSSEMSRNLTWMYYNTPYVGVAILDPPRSTPAANLALIDHAIYVSPYSGLPDNVQIQFMDGTIQNASSDRPYNWSTCNSAGPFTLIPGETAIAAFAILGGDDLSDLQANADTAYDRYWNWPGVKETPCVGSVIGVRIYPVISSCGRPCILHYAFTKETPLRMKLYDALGRLVGSKDYGVLNSTGEFPFSLKSLAQGIYFVRVEAGNKINTSKIIWLK